MKIILIEDVKNLGVAGDVVKVANGYGRNYLLPKKFAVLATPFNLKKIENIRKVAEDKRETELNSLKVLAQQVGGQELAFSRRADEEGNLFGSVSDIDIVNALQAKEMNVKKSMVRLEKAIKEVGEVEVTIHFAPEIESTVKITVAAE